MRTTFVSAGKSLLPIDWFSCQISVFEPEKVRQPVVNDITPDIKTGTWPRTPQLEVTILRGSGALDSLAEYIETPLLPCA